MAVFPPKICSPTHPLLHAPPLARHDCSGGSGGGDLNLCDNRWIDYFSGSAHDRAVDHPHKLLVFSQAL